MKDVRLGSRNDRHTQRIQGLVARIDPSVRDGTVTVDVALTGDLPAGAAPTSPSKGRSSSNACKTCSSSAGLP
jgi:hypothetical protein